MLFSVISLVFHIFILKETRSYGGQKQPLSFLLDMHSVEVGKNLRITITKHASYASEIHIKHNDDVIVNCTRNCVITLKNRRLSVFINRNNYFMNFYKIIPEDAGIYSIDFVSRSINNELATPITGLIVLVKPTCNAWVVESRSTNKTKVTKDTRISESMVLMMTCHSSYYASKDNKIPRMSWVGLKKKAHQTDEVGSIPLNSSYPNSIVKHFRKHEINFAVDYLTDLSKINCVVSVMEGIRKSGPVSGLSTSKVFRSFNELSCHIPQPNILYCPIHVKVVETDLGNGSRKLICQASANPKPVFVWQSTNSEFESTLGKTIIVDKPGYYTCTARHSLSEYPINCNPQLTVHSVNIGGESIPVLFSVISFISLLLTLSGIVCMYLAAKMPRRRVYPRIIQSIMKTGNLTRSIITNPSSSIKDHL